MSATDAQPASIGVDGRTRVALDELIALRLRVQRGQHLQPVAARAARSGGHASVLRGRGMDYAESRAYQAGDDVRQVDWRLTARSGRLHTKLYQQERERSVLVLVDTNPSMRFGTQQRFKSVQAARAAALIAWCVSHADERIGALAFGGCRDWQRPMPGHRGALATVGALARWDAAAMQAPSRAESLVSALQRARRAARGSSRVVLISDGQSCTDEDRAGLLQLRRHVDLGILVVADALELHLPPAGRYALEHDGVHTMADLGGAAQRQAFRQSLGAGAQRLAALAERLGLRHRSIDTREDPWNAVNFLLGRRTRGAA